jgi:hypothetical protein
MATMICYVMGIIVHDGEAVLVRMHGQGLSHLLFLHAHKVC